MAARAGLGSAASAVIRSPSACFATGLATAVVLAVLRRRLKTLLVDSDPDDEHEPEPLALDSSFSSVVGAADGRSRGDSSSSRASLGRQMSVRLPGDAGSLFARIARKVSGLEEKLEERMTFVERRYFSPPRFTAEMCRSTEDADLRPWQEMRQRWLLAIADGTIGAPKVHNRLWVTYRMWVDAHVAGREGRPDMFHNFCIARALGVPTPSVGGGPRWWTGAEAGDLIACLAAEGILVRGCETGRAAMEEFLQVTDARTPCLRTPCLLMMSPHQPSSTRIRGVGHCLQLLE